MKTLCVHLMFSAVQLPVPREIEWLITVEFVNHLKKKWPGIHCHVLEEGENCHLVF